MPSSRWKRFLKHHWLDLLATVAIWLFFFCLALPRLLAGAGSFEVWLAVLAPAILFPLWVYARLGPLAFKLADPARRAHIAITPMPASEYLSSQLKTPLLMTSLPFSIMAAAFVLSCFDREGQLPFAITIYLFSGAFSVYAAYVGILDFLRLLCKNCHAEATFTLFMHYALGLFLFFAIGIFSASLFSCFFFMALPLLSIPLINYALNYARKSWEITCKAYYRFE